jgi:GNAT superfamily N-acetyltransferase
MDIPATSEDSPKVPLRLQMLPAGWVAEVVTYLEMREPAPLRPDPAAGGMTLQRVRPDSAGFRKRFRRVGEPWLWASRLRLDDATLDALLASEEIEIYDLTIGPDTIGLLELDFRTPGACALAFFGVVPEAIGIGAGRFLMNRAIERAWGRAPRIQRFCVHTCTNDHPEALGFYIRSGFVPYARGVECYPDPRLNGLLPREAAPQIPIL